LEAKALASQTFASRREAPVPGYRVRSGGGYDELGLPSRFPYQDVVDELRAAIVSGELPAGARLPSENQLAERFETSRPTVRRAVALLKAQGLVTTEQGRGAFVRAKPHVRLLLSGENFRRHRREGVSGFNAQVQEQGQAAEQRLLDVGWVLAQDEVAVRLGVEQGAQVAARRRLFVVNDEPVALCDSYYPSEVARGTALVEPERIAGGAYGLIEDAAGPIARTLQRSIDDLECRMPTQRELEQLRLDPGVPVVRVLRTVYDSDGVAVEVQDTVAAADKHQFRYEVTMR
jgi:GntR family transcriptional regulator